MIDVKPQTRHPHFIGRQTGAVNDEIIYKCKWKVN